MRKLIVSLLVLGLLAIPAVANADIDDWPHDMLNEEGSDYNAFTNFSCPALDEAPRARHYRQLLEDGYPWNGNTDHSDYLMIITYVKPYPGTTQVKWIGTHKVHSPNLDEGETAPKKVQTLILPKNATITHIGAGAWVDYQPFWAGANLWNTVGLDCKKVGF